MSDPVTIQHIEILDDPHMWKGYKIVTNDATKNITCKISNDQDCCEVYGAHCRCEPKEGSIPPDTTMTLDDFIGAHYVSVSISKHVDEQYVELGGDMTARVDITILTDRGTMVVQLFNEHNGYYQHDFYVETEHGIVTEYL